MENKQQSKKNGPTALKKAVKNINKLIGVCIYIFLNDNFISLCLVLCGVYDFATLIHVCIRIAAVIVFVDWSLTCQRLLTSKTCCRKICLMLLFFKLKFNIFIFRLGI